MDYVRQYADDTSVVTEVDRAREVKQMFQWCEQTALFLNMPKTSINSSL